MVHRRLTLVKQAIPLVVFVASIYRSIHHSIDYCAHVFFGFQTSFVIIDFHGGLTPLVCCCS